MRAGRLRHRVTIEQNTPTRNGKGEEIDSWAPFDGPRYAAVIALTGHEAFNAQQRYTEAEIRIEMRYFPGITGKMRVSFGGRSFDILQVASVGTPNRETHLLVKERN